MALVPGTPLTVTDSSPIQADTVVEADARPGVATFERQYGNTLTIVTDGPVHLGGSSAVTNSGPNRGALVPAGVWPIDLSGSDHVWLIAPTGATVTVERFQVGV